MNANIIEYGDHAIILKVPHGYKANVWNPAAECWEPTTKMASLESAEREADVVVAELQRRGIIQ